MVLEEIIKTLKDSITEDIDKSSFSAFYNLFILPAAQILQPVLASISELDNIHSLSDVSRLSDEQMDDIAANFLINRNYGNSLVLSVRAVLKEEKEVNISSETEFKISLGSDTYYFNSTGVHLDPQQYVQSIKYGNSYLSIPFEITSNSTDAILNTIEIGSVISSSLENSNIIAFVADSVKTKTVQKESNNDLFLRIIHSVGSRSTSSNSGIVGAISENFPKVSVTHIFGGDDLHILRDKTYFYLPSYEWITHNFRGKKVGDVSVPHSAYVGLLIASGVDYTLEGTTLYPGSPLNLMYIEASQENYDNLGIKEDLKSFSTGHNEILPSTSFLSDTEWTMSNASVGFDRLLSGDEISISEQEGYVLGRSLDTYDYYLFVKNLMEIK